MISLLHKKHCQTCFEAAAECFPQLDIFEHYDILFGATCYPFGCVEHVRPQLEKLVAAGCKTAEECCALADDETWQTMTGSPHEPHKDEAN